MHDTVKQVATSSFRVPVVIWLTMLGIYVLLRLVDLPPDTEELGRRFLSIAFIVSLTWVVLRLADAVIGRSGRRTERALQIPNLVTNLTRAFIITIGALILLQTLAIPVTPLVTALGIGGLAIGLALQDTLANLFAGIHILVSSQVRRGDYIRLQEGEEGYVQDVTWRYTTIKQLGGNLTIVPNAKLASAVTSNYNRPATEQAVLVDVTVSYDADLAQVEKVAEDVAREVMHGVPGGVPQFQPFVRYGSLGDVGVKFSVIMRGTDYVAQYMVTHEFIKRLHQRFRDDGIDFARLPRPVGAPPAAVPVRQSATGNGRALSQQER